MPNTLLGDWDQYGYLLSTPDRDRISLEVNTLRRPGIGKVAEQAGVSISTVSRVLKGAPGVHPDTENRIHQAMRDLGYTPRQETSNRRQKPIAVIVPDIRNPFFSELIHWVGLQAAHHGYPLIITNAEDPDRGVEEVESLFRYRALSGVLVATGALPDASLALLIKNKIPAVLIARDLDTSMISSVVTDDELGGRLVARHLLQCHPQRWAILTETMRWRSSRARLDGFSEVLAEHDITAIDHWESDDSSLVGGYDACRRHLVDGPWPLGLFTTTDVLALGILRYCRENHLDVPGQVQLVGYDGTMLAELADPKLTTVRQQFEEIAQAALNLLVDHIETPGVVPRKIVLPPTLVLGESTTTTRELVSS